jgi:hypothetical protein
VVIVTQAVLALAELGYLQDVNREVRRHHFPLRRVRDLQVAHLFFLGRLTGDDGLSPLTICFDHCRASEQIRRDVRCG